MRRTNKQRLTEAAMTQLIEDELSKTINNLDQKEIMEALMKEFKRQHGHLLKEDKQMIMEYYNPLMALLPTIGSWVLKTIGPKLIGKIIPTLTQKVLPNLMNGMAQKIIPTILNTVTKQLGGGMMGGAQQQTAQQQGGAGLMGGLVNSLMGGAQQQNMYGQQGNFGQNFNWQ